jgi:gelsolin
LTILIFICCCKQSIKNAKGLLSHTIHFWLGDGCSQDEAGTAAYKTVELDEFLGGGPVEYREVQGFESTLFISIFPNFTILHGGVASGFKHVESGTYPTRLLHVHGDRKQVYVDEVPLAAASLNQGDVFILDLGLKLIQWNGSKSSGPERMKAGQYAAAIDSERSGKATISVHAEGDSDLGEFWKTLGGEGVVAPPIEHKQVKRERAIWKLSDASGNLTFSQISKGSISKSSLDSSDVFIVDGGSTVFAWVGSKTTPTERRGALGFASSYLANNGLAPTTSIVRVIDGGESPEFEAAFK